MFSRHYLIQIKLVEKLALSNLPPTHHGPPPRITASLQTESRFVHRLNQSFATHSLRKRPSQRTWLNVCVVPILLQKSEVARRRIFRENTKREATADSVAS